MITKDEVKSFEDCERAIVKRLCENCRKQNKQNNINDLKKLFKILFAKYQTKPTTEYIKFLIRFYTDKNNNTTKKILSRFLKHLDIKFKNLPITATQKKYRKLIKAKLRDYDSDDENSDLKAFEGCLNSHIASYGSNIYHRLEVL